MEYGREVPGTGTDPDRRRLLQGLTAGAVGAVAWHSPSIRHVDLRGARALAAASAPLVATVTATSTTRTQGSNTWQIWGRPSTTYTVPFPTGDVTVTVQDYATDKTPASQADGTWFLTVNTIPPGCTSCQVTNITMTCSSGTANVTGVPGTAGDVHCLNSNLDETGAVTATFTVTCT